ncbi:hypothetical protein C8K18_11172 [Paraburkholderia sp. GV068]|nr:hypothetical protein CUJ91_23465 [Paraburkholderia graminis]PTQ95254.1 hypothetical protein C8K19_11272 [Paraburkholderia sp. GV072]PUB01908.1 hypothetical protein C8K18_11172 [Paraburkholderia sp. GV068]
MRRGRPTRSHRLPAFRAARYVACEPTLRCRHGGTCRFAAPNLGESNVSSKAIAALPAASVGGIEGAGHQASSEKAAGRAALVPTSVKLAGELAQLRDIASPPQGPVKFSLSRKGGDNLPVLRRPSVVVIAPGAARVGDDSQSSWTRTLPVRPVQTRFSDAPPIGQAAFDAAAARDMFANIALLVEFTKRVGEVIHGAT